MHYIQSWRPWECDSPTGDVKSRLPKEEYDRAMDLAEEAMTFWQNTKRHTRQQGYGEIEVIFGVLIGHLHKNKKCRIVIDYDPAEEYVDVCEYELTDSADHDTPMPLTDVPLKSPHPKTNCETAYELSIEDIENAPDQDIGDAILFHMTKTADGAIEICPSKDGQITLRNAGQVNWFINQLLGLSRS